MNEVKVYDRDGNLKKIITKRMLNIRSNKQLATPSVFLKNKRPVRQPPKTNQSQGKSGTLRDQKKLLRTGEQSGKSGILYSGNFDDLKFHRTRNFPESPRLIDPCKSFSDLDFFARLGIEISRTQCNCLKNN